MEQLQITKPTPHESLMRSLQQSTVGDLLEGKATAWKYQLVEVQRAASFDIAFAAKKIFQVKSQMGDEMMEKLVCAVLIAFCDGLKLKDKPDGVEIYEMAIMYLDEYPYESVTDLILCLKMVKLGKLGVVYARFDLQVLGEFLKKYFEMKIVDIEERNKTTYEPVNTPQHTKMHLIDRMDKEEKNKALQAKVQEHFMVKEIIEKRMGVG